MRPGVDVIMQRSGMGCNGSYCGCACRAAAVARSGSMHVLLVCTFSRLENDMSMSCFRYSYSETTDCSGLQIHSCTI